MPLKETFFVKSIRGALTHVFYDASAIHNSYKKLVPAKLPRYGSYILLGSAILASSISDPAQTVGWLGLGLFLYSLTMKNNSNIRPLASGGASLLALQNYLQGAFSGAAQASIAAIRPLVNSFIPDRLFRLRYATGIAGLMAGALIMKATDSGEHGYLHYLPLLGMVFGTIADAMPDSRTNYARILRIAGALPIAGYHGLISHSVPSILTELIGIGILTHTAWKYDIKKEPEFPNRQKLENN